MLPRKKRLSRAQFNRFFSVGKRLNLSSFQLIYTKESDLHASVVVSKKVAKTAVARNKLRRRIYDIVRNYIKSHGEGSGVFIFIMRQPAILLTYVTLRTEVEQGLKKAIANM